MYILVIAVILGIFFAFFAGQNTHGVDIQLYAYQLVNIPLYLIVLGSLLLGILISYLFNLVEGLSSAWRLRSSENRLKATQQNVDSLNRHIQELELENARLKGKNIEETVKKDVAVTENRTNNFFNRLRNSFST